MDRAKLVEQLNAFTVAVGLSDGDKLRDPQSDTAFMLIDALSVVYQCASSYVADARIDSYSELTEPEVSLGDLALVVKAVAETQVMLLAKLSGREEAPEWIYSLNDFVRDILRESHDGGE